MCLDSKHIVAGNKDSGRDGNAVPLGLSGSVVGSRGGMTRVTRRHVVARKLDTIEPNNQPVITLIADG